MRPELMGYEKVALSLITIHLMAVVPLYTLGAVLLTLGSNSRRATRAGEWLQKHTTTPALIGAGSLFLITWEIGARIIITWLIAHNI